MPPHRALEADDEGGVERFGTVWHHLEEELLKPPGELPGPQTGEEERLS